jgi:hypothetical protein
MTRTNRKPERGTKKSTRKPDPVLELTRLTIKQLTKRPEPGAPPTTSGCACGCYC